MQIENWRIRSQEDLICAVYAAVKGHYWTVEDLSNWAADLLLQVEAPPEWLMDFVIVRGLGDLQSAFFKAYGALREMRLDDMEEFRVRFALLAYQEGALNEIDAKAVLADITDPWPVLEITVEDVDRLCLDEWTTEDVVGKARNLVGQISSKHIVSVFKNC
ncbi:hypothetical protein [Ruegeria lacuscaerulensis]|uniref:hypothetical protein n=1 Tax=Ruegeria lacuscaerulensis TaxID=55218 RepID=UPI001481A27A|nr:hypothetical protein [Ruegeria lacuscaerulensis]